MKIAFCTTCKNRTQHLEKTLPQNLADNADFKDCVFIVLDYDSRDHLLQFLRENHQLRDICRTARIENHPDRGGSHETFVAIGEAERILCGAAA